MSVDVDRGQPLIRPHAGPLRERLVCVADAGGLLAHAAGLRSVTLDAWGLADLELLGAGGATPLMGFLGRADHHAVLASWRLASGALFPVPLTLAVPDADLEAIVPGDEVALRDEEGALHGLLTVREAWRRDPAEEACLVVGTDDPRHPEARRLRSRPPGTLGGEVTLLPLRHRAPETARQVRARLAAHGFARVAAGLHGTLDEAAPAAAVPVDALLARSLAGSALLPPALPVVVAGLPLRLRAAGAREALLAALVLRNFGVSHLVVDPARLDLKTADALLRYRDDLGLSVLAGAAPIGPERPARRVA